MTRREAEILHGILDGMDNAAIAAGMNIGERTVKFHLSGLLKKTGTINRQRLLRLYAGWKAGLPKV